jgi:hypothetical protein
MRELLDRETSKKGKWVTLHREKKECPYGKCRGSEEEKQGERESVWEAVWVIEFKLRCAKLGIGVVKPIDLQNKIY